MCAWGDVEYINHPNTVINVCLRWRRNHYSSKYCHQCVLEVAWNTLIIQILSLMCAWAGVEYINHPKYCHQYLLEETSNTLIIQILSSICAWDDVEYINHPNTVINVCLSWNRILYSSKYCHQCVFELASNTFLIQILSSICAWGDVKYINHPNTVINVCLSWRRIHYSSKYCHQCVCSK